MRAFTTSLPLLCLILLPAGCNRHAASPAPSAVGAVAIIDLDEIARRLGSDKQIVDSISKRQISLSQQLTDLAKSYSQQIEEQKKKLAGAGQDKPEVTVANYEQQANANLNKVKQQAELQLQQHRAQLVAQFREEIKPVARRIAQSRGLSVIVTRHANVLCDFAPAADITEPVIAELLATRTPTQAAQVAAQPAVPTPK
jgi:Skp family chaperone for outer membrane proteins